MALHCILIHSNLIKVIDIYIWHRSPDINTILLVNLLKTAIKTEGSVSIMTFIFLYDDEISWNPFPYHWPRDRVVWTSMNVSNTTLWYFDIFHYNDVIMGEMTSQITSLVIVYSNVYSGADQRKHQSSASLILCGEFTYDISSMSDLRFIFTNVTREVMTDRAMARLECIYIVSLSEVLSGLYGDCITSRYICATVT